MQTKDGIREEYWVVKKISEGKFLLFEDEMSLETTEDEAQQFIDHMVPDSQKKDYIPVKVTIFEQDTCEKCNQRRNSVCRVACNCGFTKCPKCNMTHRKGTDCACGTGIKFV